MPNKSKSTKRRKRRKPSRRKGLTTKKKVDLLWEDKRDDKRILDAQATMRPTIPAGVGAGWALYSFVDDIQMGTQVAAGAATPGEANSQNGLRKDTKIRLENLSIDLFLRLHPITGDPIPNYSACRFRVVVFSTANWHYPTVASPTPVALDAVNILPVITKYSDKEATGLEMWNELFGDQYLYGKWSCQPQGLKYRILYDKRHMLSYNTVNSTACEMLYDTQSYSASQKNISIELKKKVRGHEVVYSIDQTNKDEPSGLCDIDKGNLFIAVVNDYNPSGAPVGTAPEVSLSYRLKYFT